MTETKIEDTRSYFNGQRISENKRLIHFLEERENRYPNSKLSEPIRYAIVSEAKRLRGVTFLEMGILFGDSPEMRKYAITIAAGIDCIHEASVILDDIQDKETDDGAFSFCLCNLRKMCEKKKRKFSRIIESALF